jgi:hypothetical protein
MYLVHYSLDSEYVCLPYFFDEDDSVYAVVDTYNHILLII